MTEQKFRRGNLVRIAADLGDSMRHFRAAAEAIVMGSYADQYGGNNTKTYTVLFPDTGGQCSWYHEPQLELIDEGGEHLIIEVLERRKAREAVETDIDWILKNWPEIGSNPPSATCEALMRMIGITNPWGSRGEGMTWMVNAQLTLAALGDVLKTGDRALLEARARELRDSHKERTS